MNLLFMESVKRSWLIFLLTIFLSLSVFRVNGQKITVDNSLSAQELIENHLVEGCVEVSNISSPLNGSVNGFSSFGYFERDLSNFPFENGILLTSGNAASAGNTVNDNILNDGESNWGTDPDLEAALGISNTLNATVIEFDFTSITNLIQFNYILASEEYFGNFPCEYSDGFAFLIKEAGTPDPFTNIALIPGTNIPVNTNTIHDEIVGFCPAENETYFDGYSIGDTNYNGRTTVLTATANIIPNVAYRIKLVIADQTDENYDSAVFIQGNSFVPTVDLGPDVSTCATTYEIDGDIQNPQASYQWFRNGVLIPGENGETLNVNQSGNYEVLITIPLNNEDCILEDSIQVNLNSTQTAAPLTDLEICDDLSGDGTEIFNLSDRDAEALDAVPPGNYSISYHLSSSDAQNNINPVTAPISNTMNPQPVFVRIEDLDSGCLAFTGFNLVVNPMPVVNSPLNQTYCDDGVADGSTTIDLTELDTGITQGNPQLQVTYHYSQADADTGANAIPSPYVNTLSTETLFIRVINTETGCSNTGSFDIEVLDRPDVDPQSIPFLNACEPDDDGYAFFDLTEVVPDILAQVSNATITFHETQEEAQTGDNPIADETNYQNTVQSVQTLYIRVVDNDTGCYTVVPLEIHTNVLITGVNLWEFSACDDESGDGVIGFNLENVVDTIGNNIQNITITLYETEEDLNNLVNPIDTSVSYVVSSSPTTLYVHLAVPDCERTGEITLVVDPPVIIDPVGPFDYCDTDTDGFTSVDLSAIDSHLIGTTPDLMVTYFLSETDAIDNVNPLPPFYTNISNPQTLFARVSNPNTDCFDTVEVELNIIPAPTTSQPDDIVICDDDQDGTYIVDLTALIPDMVSDTTDLSISFHESETDATSASNAIIAPENYAAVTSTIFTRIQSDITGCFALVEVPVIINTLPEFQPISDFTNCESDGNQTAEFLMSEKDEEILNGQLGKEVLYFESESDAHNRVNTIDKFSPYTNLSSPQTIYVRVENITDTTCYGVSSFEIEVGSIPIFNSPTNYIVCDDISNDGFYDFDLSEKVDEITQGSPETLNLSFHTSFEDADNSINPIDLNYTNVENPQQIYVRIDNGTYCYAVAEFGLNVVQVPTVNLPSAMTTCDTDYDGIATFDLTVSEFEILDIRNDDIVISYFESEADLENNVNTITNPENYQNISNPQTVYVQVLNTISGCYAVLPLDLSVDLPPLLNDIPEIFICESDSNEFDLSEATQILVDDPTGMSIAFYSSQTEAENESNPLPQVFNYSATVNTVYVRADYQSSGCYRIQSFNLVINPNPIANAVADQESCDDDYDFELVFDLGQQIPAILGGQDPAVHLVTFYETEVDTLNGQNAISDESDYNAYDGQVIYYRIENINTGCFSINSYNIVIHRKPVVEIEQQVICLDNLPLIVDAGEIVSGDSYSWSTGENTPSIEINAIGTYSVTVTTPEGCSTTSTFDVIESESANIEITETVDFSDPNNVTITISGIGDYLYILDDGEPQESNVFENVSLGYHTVTVIDLNGCGSVTTEVLVIDAPKFMTPNGDGYFDTWHIVGVETLPGTTIDIFDRYGKQLAHLTSATPGWNGLYNGRMMPATDYWFVANVVQGNRQFQVKGHFALRR